MERRRSDVTQIEEDRQRNQAREIWYNKTSVKLVDYALKRDPEVQWVRDRSVVLTDQGEYAAGVKQLATIPDLIFFYSNLYYKGGEKWTFTEAGGKRRR